MPDATAVAIADPIYASDDYGDARLLGRLIRQDRYPGLRYRSVRKPHQLLGADDAQARAEHRSNGALRNDLESPNLQCQHAERNLGQTALNAPEPDRVGCASLAPP